MIQKIKPVYERAIVEHSRDWWTVRGPGPKREIDDYHWWFGDAIMRAAAVADAADLAKLKEGWPEIFAEWEAAGIEADRKDREEAERVAMNKAIQLEYRQRDKERLEAAEQRHLRRHGVLD